MLNEERIILMTHMASYEENEGKKYVAIGKYFRNDYIGFQLLKSIISATIAFMIVFGMFIFYDFEVFMQDIYKMDLLVFAKNVLTAYAVTVGGYVLITYIVSLNRYNKARKSLKCYYNNLKKLSGIYEK